ncbi:MAG: efflux RND transporter periplasmic adaptor subunit [Salinisphaera sp.]|nr:efflux RND transporter periplasmic adaptor subunit [Salinisphaera sp.]
MKLLTNLHPGWVAALVAVAIALWLASGTLGSDSAPATSGATGQRAVAPKPGDVQGRVSHAESIMRTATVAGRTAPVRTVTLQAQIAGQVAQVTAERGDHVEAGEVIARLSKEDLGARRAEAQATLAQRRLQFDAARKLAARGYQTQVGVATAKANLEAARAAVAAIQTRLDHTVIRAPFAGVLETLPVEEGDYLGVGDVVGRVIQQNPFIVWGNVTEDVVPWLEEGQPGSATLASGKTRDGTVRFVASVADEATRTYRVELRIENPDGRLIAGSSAQLHLPLEQVSAHKVEPAILTINEQGVFGIKSVSEDGRVHFHEAQIALNENDHLWLTGLPQTLRIITVGQGFVRPGDLVDVVVDSDQKMVSDGASSRP